jgi:glutamine synthetase adenylyltransferase
MIQLRFGGVRRHLRGLPVLRLLALDDCPALSPEERRQLTEHYVFFRRAEAMNRLALEGRSAVLPSGSSLETLARCSAGLSAEQFRTAMARRMSDVRELYHRFCERLSGGTA